MLQAARPFKRQRSIEPLSSTTHGSPCVMDLLRNSQWPDAIERLKLHSEEGDIASSPSPLAIACRAGAPIEVIQALLNAAPQKVRHVLDSRGTPLHEAIVCETTSLSVLEILLLADEAMGTETTRATLKQDIDGFTPLHLLIRRRFQTHILLEDDSTEGSNDRSNYLMSALELLVKSCPEAIVIPDRGEYEESPIVYALKANIYSPMLGSEDATLSRIEQQIYDMVACMLRYLPSAAGHVLNGYRGRYTALHSAVFHGRCTKTIELLLQQGDRPNQSALLVNTQGEIPLHFCMMRGEQPRTVHVLARAAPEAVFKRDAAGLTPFHWLWVRYVSAVQAWEVSRRDGNEATAIVHRDMTIDMTKYTEFWTLEQGDFELDLQLMRRMDPAVDFLRMRHIPAEAHDETLSQQWVEQGVHHLRELRRRAQDLGQETAFEWTRQEVVTSHFWTKCASLLEAAQMDETISTTQTVGRLTHTAFESPCPSPVAHMISLLFPEELSTKDEFGRLPLHCAAMRPWHSRDVPRDQSQQTVNESDSLLYQESLNAMKIALNVSPSDAACVFDNGNRLVLHHAIDTFVNACSLFTRSSPDSLVTEMLDVLKCLVDRNPASLEHQDGATKLYPFLQATATASERQDAYRQEELALSISFELLRWNPIVLTRACSSAE
ncbi:hypothetical protein MPSEU_000230600 [Mayamaea pseudoterrestris]|nr:hypothetical protein MPSEU_000230600 [Mayamaea pseudoterrestris]